MNLCKPCNVGCSTCTNGNACGTCTDGFEMNLSTGVCECPSGMFIDDTVCRFNCG